MVQRVEWKEQSHHFRLWDLIVKGAIYVYTIQFEKHEQVKKILEESKVDWWLTLGRETSMNLDPILPFISTIDYTALAAVIMTPTRSIALVGHNDAEGLRQTGVFDEIIGYETSFQTEITKLIERDQPKNIALNYSVSDVAADGLTHGLYRLIHNIFDEIKYSGDVISAEDIIAEVRGCKSEEEINRIKAAIKLTDGIYQNARTFIKEGVTEKEIFDFFHNEMERHGVEPAWQRAQCPGVMVGPLTVTGHKGPTDIVAEKGTVMDIDFGVKLNGYCSDLQRAYYVLDDGETEACEEVQRAFEVVQEAIRRALKGMKPGKTGSEIDQIARDYIVSQGYPEWTHGLGHQLGQLCHDGGVSLAPNKWERYTDREVNLPVKEGMVFTLEPGIRTSRGYVGQEEVAVVTKDGGKLLSEPQKGIFLV